jgi:methionyl-tRNA synthetase
MSKFYLTTPIYYPNARPHVGSAYTTIVCDVIARYKRMCGDDVAFLTGTDEHGEKLRRAAEEAGKSPAEFVAEKRKLFTSLWRTLGIPQFSTENPAGYRFVHTSQNPDHVESVHWMIRRAQKAGFIDKRKYEGRYCIFDERYVSDSSEPVNCDICGRPAELISEENYFFRLSAFGKPLLDLYDKPPAFVQPDYRRNEVISFVKSGLRDISISRKRLKWGIPWPEDPEQVVYVWYDALTSYLTGIGFTGEKRSKDFEKYWMGAEGPTEVVHMIGKDIIRFHAVYWPAFLMAAGLPLPKIIFAHGWIYYEQDKMSKSKGNVIYPEPIVDALDSFGAPGNDALRYYLLRDTPFGQDASFSYDGLVQRYNSDLANGLGNLASRTLAMLGQFCDSEVPPRPAMDMHDRYWDVEGLYRQFQDSFRELNFFDAVGLVAQQCSLSDKVINEAKPWELAKSTCPADQQILQRTLYQVADFLRAACILLYPVMPQSAQRLWTQLGCESYLGKLTEQRIDQVAWGGLKRGTRVGKPQPIFPRLDKADAVARLNEFAEADRKSPPAPTEKEKPLETPFGEERAITEKAPAQPVATPAAAPASEKISIEDFAKVEMRVGEILSAEPIPKATKLLKLQVDIGAEVRQVCAGIAEYYQPEQLVGMKVVLVTNLQPRKLRGVESNGMIVAASVGDEGRPVLATFKEDVPKGAKLR